MINYNDIKHPRNKRLHTRPTVPEGDDRSPAQRDRDRIVYTSAFRRLAEVTQVVSPDGAHVFHNRLTHSLLVAQVGRSLAERLRRRNIKLVDTVGGIDPDVVEAACLAHDLGHPPFGHTAEQELNKLAKGNAGGFEGNAQSFRIVTRLAFKSEKHPGLDLTRATLAAILKYPWFKGQNSNKPKKWGAYRTEVKNFRFARKLRPKPRLAPTAEASLMDWADDVTYSVHDVDDFYRAGCIPMHLLCTFKSSRERQHFFDDVYERHRGDKNFFKRRDLEAAFEGYLIWYWRIYEPYSGTSEQRSKLRYFNAQLIHRYIDAVKLDQASRTVRIDNDIRKEVAILKELTWTYVIEAPALSAQREGQKQVIRRLFNVYADAAASRRKWGIFPPYYKDRLRKSSSQSARTRIVVDLITGMTEKQAVETYRQFTGIRHSSSLEQIVR